MHYLFHITQYFSEFLWYIKADAISLKNEAKFVTCTIRIIFFVKVFISYMLNDLLPKDIITMLPGDSYSLVYSCCYFFKNETIFLISTLTVNF